MRSGLSCPPGYSLLSATDYDYDYDYDYGYDYGYDWEDEDDTPFSTIHN